MQEQVNALSIKAQEVWGRVSFTQRMVVGILSLLSLAILFGFFYWMSQPNFKVLYSKLTAEDTNRVVKILEADKIPYELANGGNSILVPEDDVYPVRIKIAGEGNLVGTGIGFEIFDEIKVGQTDFVQQINYQRALQGELARTIGEFPNIESVRVHLVIPKRSLFIEEQQKPSASIMLRLVDKSRKMQDKEVAGIVNLLSMAVEGLDRSRISITDSLGKPLFFPDEDGMTALTTTQRDHKLRVERDLERRVNELLFPVLGPGKVIAKINADLDFSQRTIRRELYDPDSAVMRSQQTSEENTIGRANIESGSPDVNFRGDGIGGALTSQEGTRETRATNYEINKEEHSIVSQVGAISRLTVAVILDGSYIQNAEGESVYTARTPEEVANIKILVANAVGIDLKRGDSIEVSTVPFGIPEIPKITNTEILGQYLDKLGKPVLGSLLAFLFLVIVVRPIVLALIRPKVEAGEILEGLEGLPSADEQLALYEAQEVAAQIAESQRMSALLDGEDYEEVGELGLKNLKHLDDVKIHTLQLAENNLDQSLIILRGWMRNEAQSAADA